MNHPRHPVPDADLIARVRGGDVSAYGTLFSRHVDAAARMAASLAGPQHADELVSGAFVQILTQLRRGGGPDVAFRAYLLTAVRSLYLDRVSVPAGGVQADDLTPYDTGLAFLDPELGTPEGAVVTRALASLPGASQLVLWHLEVENQRPAAIAPLLGITTSAVSTLADRARGELRSAFVRQHDDDDLAPSCRATREVMTAHLRRGLSRRGGANVDDHLAHCRRCTALYLELDNLTASPGAVLAPALLGSAASGYVTSTRAQSPLEGKESAWERLRVAATSGRQTAVIAAAAVGLAGSTAMAGLAVTQRDLGQRTAQPSIAAPRLPPGTDGPVAATPDAGPVPRTASPPTGSRRTAGGGDAAPSSGAAPAPSGPSGVGGDPTGRGATAPGAGAAGTDLAPRPTQSLPDQPRAGRPDRPDPKTDLVSQQAQTSDRADIAVSVSEVDGASQAASTRISARITGLPEGRRTQLTISAINGARVTPGRGLSCEGSGGMQTCLIGAGNREFTLAVYRPRDTTVSLLASDAIGLKDPDGGNNSTSLHLTAPRQPDPTRVRDSPGPDGEAAPHLPSRPDGAAPARAR